MLIAATVCTKSGKGNKRPVTNQNTVTNHCFGVNIYGTKPYVLALVSRQFVEMTKARIEGLLAAFPKLMTGGRQHTFVETESVR